MLIIEAEKAWFQLIYDEAITEKEFVESLQAFYTFAMQNPKQVTKLFNSSADVNDRVLHRINLAEIGF